MKDSTLVRKPLALAAIVPLTVFGLAACAPAESDGDTNDRTEPTSAPDNGGTSSEAGGLPFPFPGSQAGGGTDPEPADPEPADPEPADPTPDPTTPSGGGTGGSGGNGTDVVTFGSTDLSGINWSTMCSSDPESIYLIGSDADATEDAASIMVSADEEGQPDFVLISSGGANAERIYWSSSNTKGNVNIVSTKGTFEANGTAFDYTDYSEQTPIEFNVKVECDYDF